MKRRTQPPEKGCRSRILRRLEQGRRITLVELDPPRSADIGGFMEGARQLEQAGADAITIADCPDWPSEDGFQPAGLQTCRASLALRRCRI